MRESVADDATSSSKLGSDSAVPPGLDSSPLLFPSAEALG